MTERHNPRPLQSLRAAEESQRRGFLASFNSMHGAIMTVGALLVLGVSIGGFGLGGKVSAQGEAIEKLSDENDLQFQNDVRVGTALEHIHEEQRELREDLRAMDAGRRLPPLPPAHGLEIEIVTPSASPSPTPRGTP